MDKREKDVRERELEKLREMLDCLIEIIEEINKEKERN